MAFDRLQALGEEKFKKIVNELMRGTPAMTLARTIQSEWGEFVGVAEKTLTQQLNRLRLTMQEGAFGEEAAQALKENGKIDIKMLKGVSIDVMGELVTLANVQRQRIQMIWEKEQEVKMPIAGLNTVINDQRDLLIQIQKMRFDLGLDEYKGVVPGLKMKSESISLPDGTQAHRTVIDAVTTVEQIFKSRGIEAPQVVDGSRI